MFDEGFFDKVYYRFLKIDSDNAIANIFAIHGLGGHCLWFDNAGRMFNQNKINFFSFDLPGFGQSKYPKGTISSYKEWIDITKETLQKFLIYFGIKSPVFILGHSMGASIAILLSKNVKAHGWIISVPGFEGYSQTWPLFSFVFPVLFKAIVKPNENIILPFGPELLTKNKETQLKVKKDPLRVINVSAKIFMQVYLMSLAAKQFNISEDELVLLLQAGQDKVCSNEAMLEYFNKLKSKDKVRKVYENSYHDLFIEDELEQIVNDISVWIKNKI